MFYIVSHPDISLYRDLLRALKATFSLQVPEIAWVLLFCTIYAVIITICWLHVFFVLHNMLTYVKSCSGWMASLRKAW